MEIDFSASGGSGMNGDDDGDGASEGKEEKDSLRKRWNTRICQISLHSVSLIFGQRLNEFLNPRYTKVYFNDFNVSAREEKTI